MNINNAKKIYQALTTMYTPSRRILKTPACVKELAHALMQRGEIVRKQKAEHPIPSRDMTNVFDHGTGRTLRSDAHGVVAKCGQRAPGISLYLGRLRSWQKKAPWRKHQSVAYHTRGKCAWIGCPGKKRSKVNKEKRSRSYDTFMRCEECSAMLGKDMFFCNNTKGGKPCVCHLDYHNKYHNTKYCD